MEKKRNVSRARLSRARFLAAGIVAVLAVWRLPYVMDIDRESGLFAHSALSLALAGGLALLLFSAFACREKRLCLIAYPLGFLFACFLTLGQPLLRAGAFPPLTAAEVLGGLFTVAIYTAVLGAGVALLFRGALRWTGAAAEERASRDAEGAKGKPTHPPKNTPKDSLLSRLLGNYFIVLALLLACWVPVWLAFWPGTFRYDAPTQFATWADLSLTTGHPLLHTLLLSWCLNIGLEADSMAMGVALYSGAQLFLMACMLSAACRWLYRRGAPLFARALVTALFALFPLYPLWAFSATKDVLFAGLFLLLTLQLIDLYREGLAALRSPWRMLAFALTAVGMMLMRHNGILVFALLLPVAVWAAKSARVRMLLLSLCTIGVYLLCSWGLQAATEAENGYSVELLSLPLQQLARVAQKEPEALSDEDWEILAELYPEENIAELYDPQFADPLKWAMDNDAYDADPERYLSLWRRLGAENPGIYLEAFLVQNLPYYFPGAPMRYNIVLGVEQMEFYPIEAESLLPGLQKPYQDYDRTLSFLSLPGVYLLSNNALMAWASMLLWGFALYCRRRGMVVGCTFLLLLWATNLFAPVAIMRYMLGLFYAVPVLSARALAAKGR